MTKIVVSQLAYPSFTVFKLTMVDPSFFPVIVNLPLEIVAVATVVSSQVASTVASSYFVSISKIRASVVFLVQQLNQCYS